MRGIPPKQSTSNVVTGVTGTAGRPSQRHSSRSGTSTTSPSSPSAAFISCTALTFWQSPSTATTEACSKSHSGMFTESGRRVLCNSTPVPSSCSTACMKYLESVQRPAWSAVTTTSPASPVKPVSHSTCFHLGAGYSLECGSLPLITTASHPLSDIMLLRALILCA